MEQRQDEKGGIEVNPKNFVWIGIGALAAMAIALLLLSPGARATNDPPNGGGTVVGDWTVTDTRSYQNVNIEIQDGGLQIAAGGSLSLSGVSLTFTSSSDGQYGIDVAAKGTFDVSGGGTITSSDPSVHYYFTVHGAMDMNDTTVSEVWGDSGSWKGGIQIFNDKVTITYSTITMGRTGGISIFDCSPEIDYNTISQCGMDGQSQYYSYGIYATNNHGNIIGNIITGNDYSTSESHTSGYIWPDGYDTYWNGHWWYYYYWAGYYVREEEIFGADVSYNYGKGVYIEGGSTTNLANNTIEKNGWGQFDHTNSWGQWWEDSYHYVEYSYQDLYTIPSCSGIGVYSGNSSLTISGNTIDRNGYEPAASVYTDWYNYPYQTYYSVDSGTAVSLVDSFGDIMNNAISNGAIIIDNYRSSPNITGNAITSDYGSDPSQSGDAAFIPWRVGYTIRDFECSPYIANNTIKVLSKDERWYDYNTGNQFTSIDEYVVIENSQCPDMVIENNKITITCSQGGSITALGINATLKTGLTLRNNTITYSFAGWTDQPSTIPVKLIQASMLSTVDMKGNTLKSSTGGAQGGGVTAAGIWAAFGSTVDTSGDKITGADFGLVVRDFSTITITQDTITGVTQIGMRLLGSSTATIHDSTITGSARGLEVVKSRAEIYDCTLGSPAEFLLDKAATVNLYNTKHIRGSVIMLDSDSFLNVSWSVHLTVLWQTETPVEGASVSIRDMQNNEVFTDTTDQNGTPTKTMWIKDYIAHNMVITKLTPHRVFVTKARASNMELYIVDSPLDITFHLTDNIPPDLQVLYPFDGMHLNQSLVTISGTASDAEAGILNSVVLVNIDNTGFVGADVKDGAWSFSRPLSDGMHIARIIAEDLVGNQARTTLSFSIDTAAPVLQVFTPLDGSYTNQRTITVTGISEIGAIITVNGLPAPMDKRLFTKPLSLEDGPNTVTISASDTAGNTRTLLIHVVLDTQPPILDIREPKPGAYTNQNPVSLVGTTEPLAVVKINGIKAQLVNSTFEALVDLSEGANTVTVTSTDLAGNINTQTFVVYLDTIAPDLTIFTPRDGLFTNSSRVLVSGGTEQGSSVVVNGQNVNVVGTVFSNFVSLVEGANKVTMVAKDEAGNRRSVTRTVYLDTRLPDLVLTSPANGAALPSRVVPVFGSVDWGTDVYINGELAYVKDFVFSTTLLMPDDGSFTIEVVARDQAGNTAIEDRTVHIDTIVPNITISYPDDGLKVKQGIITVTGQTEPYATLVINTETMISVGKDGLFSVPVALQNGENRITFKATDAAGNTETQARTIFKAKPAVAVKEDVTWILNLTGLLIGIGVGLPVATYLLTNSWSNRRRKVLSELEAAEAERREREAAKARKAAIPTVERMGARRKAAPAEPEQKAPAAPEPIPEAPKAEAAEAIAAKAGLKDKSGATEVSPAEIDQATKMQARSAPAEEPKAAPKTDEDVGLKDKGGEAEGAAGETELPGGIKKK
jgi:parallel beta-helix repeat protein